MTHPHWFFTADTHLGCQRMVENTRLEFESIKEHDASLIESINKAVCRDDCLVILGDFCLKLPGKYRHLIKCRHIFYILGNHCNETKVRRVFGGNVWQQRMIRCNQGDVWCNHYPMFVWDKSHYGTYSAYGHTHDCDMREAMMNMAMPGRRSLDVGVDSAKRLLGEYRPFSDSEFFDILSGRPGHETIERKDRWHE